MVRKRTLLLALFVVTAGAGVAVASGVTASDCENVNKTENLSTDRLENRTNASDYEDSKKNLSEDDGFVLTGEKLAQLAIDEILEEEPCGNETAPNGTVNGSVTPGGTATPTNASS
ncbi:hypothetical protein [Halorientalis halophila]|uniref:hypothetical protein n=1 Tax=Halorientalis halophila TaxID=3108499 RepID=UPI00300A55B2